MCNTVISNTLLRDDNFCKYSKIFTEDVVVVAFNFRVGDFCSIFVV